MPRAGLLGVFGVALALRLAHLLALRSAPFFAMPMGDGRVFDAWAREIAGGDWLGSEVFFQAPLYPYLLGVVYAIGGAEPSHMLWVQAVLGSLGCALLAAAGARLFGRQAGLAAGLLLAFYPAAIFYDGLIQKPSLVVLGVCALLYLWSVLRERPTPLGFLTLGCVLGGLLLTRENAVVLGLPIVVAIAAQASWPRGRRVWAVGAMLLGGLLLLVPVTVRNAAVGEGLVLSTSNLGPNLYIGNHRGADGLYTPLAPDRSSPDYERADATRLAEEALGRSLRPGEVSAFWVDRSLEEIAADPVAWLGLLGRKLLLFQNRLEVGDTEDLATFAAASPVLRLLSPVLHLGTLVPLALLGLVITRRDARRLWPLHAMLLLYAASVVAFFVMGRFRMPWIPLLSLFAGAAIALARAAWIAASPRARAGALALVAAASVSANWPLAPRGDSRWLAPYNLGSALALRGRHEEAVRELERAAALAPREAMIRYNLGMSQLRLGRVADATASLGTAVRLGPELFAVRDGVGRVADVLALRAAEVAAGGRQGEARSLERASKSLRRALAASASGSP